MGNLMFEREDDRMVKVMNCEEYDEWREPKVQFLRKRDYCQFLGGSTLFMLGGYITITNMPNRLEWAFAGFAIAAIGSTLALTSRLCMRE